MTSIFTSILLITGAVFMLLAAVGVLRLPDVFSRLQATSKAATLGVGCMLLAVAVYFGELGVVTRATAVVLFTFLTAPVGAHVLGRAAYIARARLWSGTVIDDLAGRYEDGDEMTPSQHPRDESAPPPPAIGE